MITNPVFNGMFVDGAPTEMPPEHNMLLQQMQQAQQQPQQPEHTYTYDFSQMDNLIDQIDDDVLAKLSHKIWKDTEREEASYAEYEDKVSFYVDLAGYQMADRGTKDKRATSSNDYIQNSGTSNLFSSTLGETLLSIVTNVISRFFDTDQFVNVETTGPLSPGSPHVPPEAIEAIKQRVSRWYKMYFTHILKNYRNDLASTLMWTASVGTASRKCYFDPVRGIPTSTLIPPGMLLNNSGFDGFYQPTEYTHKYYLTKKEIQQRVDDGLWNQSILSNGSTYQQESILTQKLMQVEGRSFDIGTDSSDENQKYPIYERYMDIEIDEDNILPAIVTYGQEGTIGSIYANCKADDPLRLSVDYFTHYRFLPSFTGESLGMANVAGQNARAATVLKRRLIDASLASAFPPAFMKPTVKFQSHTFETSPGKITTLPVGDDDISKAITFAPTASPNSFMVDLKNDLEDKIRQYSLIVTQDMMSLAQKAPQGSVLAMLSRMEEMPNCIIQGMYNSFALELNIFKRMYYEWLPDDGQPFVIEINGETYPIYKEDFSEYVTVRPGAPFTKESDAYKFMRAEIVASHAEKLPQLHNMHAIYQHFYKEMGIKDEEINNFLVAPQPPAPADIILNEAKQMPQVHDMRAVLGFYYQSKQIPPEVIQAVLPAPQPPPQEAQQIDPGVVGMAEVEAQKQIAELNAQVKMAQIESDKQEYEANLQIEIAKLDLKRVEQEKDSLELEMKIMKDQQEMALKEKDMMLKEREAEIEHLKFDIERHDEHVERAENAETEAHKSLSKDD
jgi:hypothetical protein